VGGQFVVVTADNQRGDGHEASVARRKSRVGPDLREQHVIDECCELRGEAARGFARAVEIGF